MGTLAAGCCGTAPPPMLVFSGGSAMKRLNGWQRIWVVLAALGVMWAVVYPYTQIYSYDPFRYEM